MSCVESIPMLRPYAKRPEHKENRSTSILPTRRQRSRSPKRRDQETGKGFLARSLRLVQRHDNGDSMGPMGRSGREPRSQAIEDETYAGGPPTKGARRRRMGWVLGGVAVIGGAGAFYWLRRNRAARRSKRSVWTR